MDEISDGNEKLMFGNQPLGARNYLRRFLFDDKRINERVDLLSGGERARLMLAKVLKNGGNVIVLDEPTNDLDLPSLRMLEEALAAFDGTVIVRFPRPLFPRPDLRPDHRLRGERRDRAAGKLFILSRKTPGPRSGRTHPGAGRREGCRRAPEVRRSRHDGRAS